MWQQLLVSCESTCLQDTCSEQAQQQLWRACAVLPEEPTRHRNVTNNSAWRMQPNHADHATINIRMSTAVVLQGLC
jgi:hypothetical protein